LTYLIKQMKAAEDFVSAGSRAKSLFADLILPKEITQAVVERYFRRALRNGGWRRLTRYQRALLFVAARVVKVVRSDILRRALQEIFVEVELATTRGRALLMGLTLTLNKAGEKLLQYLRNLEELLCIGLNYLNHPLFKGLL